MGYRSDVAITIYKKDFDELCKLISAKDPQSNVRSLFTYADITILGEESDPLSIVNMIWSGVKWYDGYDDVNFFMSFIQSEGRDYAYKRIGEDYDDVETDGFGDENWELASSIYISRYFEKESEGEMIDPNKVLDDNVPEGESVDLGISYDDVIYGEVANGI